MGVQVIDLGPTEENLRQKAFQQGIDRAVSMGSKAFDSVRAAEKNKRQMAMQEQARADKVREADYNKQLQMAKAGIAPVGEEGPPTPEMAQLGQLAGQAQEQSKFQQMFKQAQLDKMKREGQKDVVKDKEELLTPVGEARTKDDAKKVKAGFEAKQEFDSMLDEMIQLRETQGGEMLNREAVGRGKQLSKQLLLKMKDMAKLGVLSKSDEDILNAIIPSDPLAFRGPLEMVSGQDSVMSQLKKLKSDSQAKFDAQVATRVKGGQAGSQQFIAQQKGQAQPFSPVQQAQAAPQLVEQYRQVPKEQRQSRLQQLRQKAGR